MRRSNFACVASVKFDRQRPLPAQPPCRGRRKPCARFAKREREGERREGKERKERKGRKVKWTELAKQGEDEEEEQRWGSSNLKFEHPSPLGPKYQ